MDTTGHGLNQGIDQNPLREDGRMYEGPIAQAIAKPLAPAARDLVERFAPDTPNAEAIYLSTPITTGRMLLDWLADRRTDTSADASVSGDLVREEVIEANLARLGPLRQRIRSENPEAHLIDPTTLEMPGWSQWQYHRLWVEVIESLVDRIVFADGWELSTGCTIEYATGLALGIPMQSASGEALLPEEASVLLRDAAQTIRVAGRDPAVALDAIARSDLAAHRVLKDAELARLAETHNVASFVSFSPGLPRVRYRVVPEPPIRRSAGARGAVERLLDLSMSGSVNVRSFKPEAPKGNPFHYGLRTVDDVIERVESLTSRGYYCIVNETIDIHDGGVSGVTLGGVAEFAPDDTPRAVETADAARLPIELAERILARVYGDAVVLPSDRSSRTEFSVHPMRVGQRREPVLVWEVERGREDRLEASIEWPNRFSRHIGDKTYGLLLAESIGVPVPAATVLARRVAPFSFGRSTGTGEWWMRTAPAEQTPGHFTTTRGWSDPFELLAKEDPHAAVVAVIAQEGVDSVFSGATLPVDAGEGHAIEGVAGVGDRFMLGQEAVVELPENVAKRVLDVLRDIERGLGPGVRIEWAADEENVWILQLHRIARGVETGVFSSGDAEVWLSFDPALGLDSLTELIAQAKQRGAGIEVTKPVGLTSHIGDLLRKARVPGRLVATRETGSDSE
jgi:hypothetical protein